MPAFTVGIDFGTNSVRSLIVRCDDGAEVGVSVADYPSGVAGVLLDENDDNVARQHPGDYLVGLVASFRGACKEAARQYADFDAAAIIGIGVDSTGSSPLPIDAKKQCHWYQCSF